MVHVVVHVVMQRIVEEEVAGIEEGFAKVYDEDVGQARDIRYFERFQEAQAKAQSLEKGLWGSCF